MLDKQKKGALALFFENIRGKEMFKINPKRIATLLIVCIITLASCGSMKTKTVFVPLTQTTLISEIEKETGADPTEITTENGTACYIYENSQYADYTGTTTYYCAEDQVMMSRWAYDVDEDENRGDVYNDILDTLQEEYGTFTKGDNDVTYTLQTEKETIALTSFSVEGGYNIVITYN